MTTSRTAELMSRLPRWFAEHARETEAEAQRRREAEAERFELEFLRGVEVKDSGTRIHRNLQPNPCVPDDYRRIVTEGCGISCDARDCRARYRRRTFSCVAA